MGMVLHAIIFHPIMGEKPIVRTHAMHDIGTCSIAFALKVQQPEMVLCSLDPIFKGDLRSQSISMLVENLPIQGPFCVSWRIRIIRKYSFGIFSIWASILLEYNLQICTYFSVFGDNFMQKKRLQIPHNFRMRLYTVLSVYCPYMIKYFWYILYIHLNTVYILLSQLIQDKKIGSSISAQDRMD